MTKDEIAGRRLCRWGPTTPKSTLPTNLIVLPSHWSLLVAADWHICFMESQILKCYRQKKEEIKHCTILD